MVSNQMLVEMLQKASEITEAELNIYTMDGVQIGKDGVRRSETFRTCMRLLGSEETAEENDKYYFRINDAGVLEYVLTAEGSEEAKIVGKMLKLQLESLLEAHQDRFDRDGFIKNLLLDNLLPVDIYNYAQRLGINIRSERVAFLVETKKKDDLNALETLRTMFAESGNDFVAAIDENNIIIVKELRKGETAEDLKKLAYTLADMLNTEAMSPVRIAYGNVTEDIKRVSISYKEARLALSVGKIFSSEQNVVSYSSLGIGRLIYQLPLPMCKMFIEEIFKEESPEEFDEETLTTINQFFENNLNVSETSRQLYIHRNTLVYRLDKLQKNTGLDLRVFDDAITFKIALMVVKYMRYMENQE